MKKDESICNNSGSSQSIWMKTLLPSFPELEENLDVDVCIVGSGITGLTCAYTLLKEGKTVAILEQSSIAGGQTARTTGHLTWALDDRFFELERLFGEKGARLAAESHSKAIDYIEKIVKNEQIDCDFERIDGYLFNPPEEPFDILEKEYQAIKKTGMKVNKVDKAPFGESFDTGPCLHFPNQAEFHILKYLKGLIQSIVKQGGQIFANSPAKSFEDGGPCTVTTDSGVKVTAKAVIVATCTPINDRVKIHTKQAPYRTYVIAGLIPKGTIAKGIYWDTPDPYHYIRTLEHESKQDVEWLIIGGEDHKTGQEHHYQQYDVLEQWARNRFPMLEKIEYRWSGQVFEPIDGLAYIGLNPGDRNIYIATGDSGNGMTHGTIAGLLLPDLILGRKNPWEDLYNPGRITWNAASEFFKENFNVLVHYGDWLTTGETEKIEELSPGEGKLLREGVKKIAVFKDENGKVHVNSAFCPHLGGCLQWNSAEKSWDCPLHGSRFDGCGKILNGPANGDLPHKC